MSKFIHYNLPQISVVSSRLVPSVDEAVQDEEISSGTFVRTNFKVWNRVISLKFCHLDVSSLRCGMEFVGLSLEKDRGFCEN